MLARVPGSTSNLGPGFDVLGLALSLYVSVEIRPAARFSIVTEGEGEELPQDESHLAARIARAVVGHDRHAIRVTSDIPLGRGLGSSAALAVAAAAAAGATDPLLVAAKSDGHAENAAASRLGGLVAATFVDGSPVVRPLPLDRGLVFVVLVPDHQLATSAARELLPETVPFADAVFNLGRLGLLLSGLAAGEQLVTAAGEDRLHQGPRGAIFPEAQELIQSLLANGARVATWSGAGPSLLGICVSVTDAARAAAAGEAALQRLGVPGRAAVLPPDTTGLVTTS